MQIVSLLLTLDPNPCQGPVTWRLMDASPASQSDAPSGRRDGDAEDVSPAPAPPAASAARRARSAARKRLSCSCRLVGRRARAPGRRLLPLPLLHLPAGGHAG